MSYELERVGEALHFFIMNGEFLSKDKEKSAALFAAIEDQAIGDQEKEFSLWMDEFIKLFDVPDWGDNVDQFVGAISDENLWTLCDFYYNENNKKLFLDFHYNESNKELFSAIEEEEPEGELEKEPEKPQAQSWETAFEAIFYNVFSTKKLWGDGVFEVSCEELSKEDAEIAKALKENIKTHLKDVTKDNFQKARDKFKQEFVDGNKELQEVLKRFPLLKLNSENDKFIKTEEAEKAAEAERKKKSEAAAELEKKQRKLDEMAVIRAAKEDQVAEVIARENRERKERGEPEETVDAWRTRKFQEAEAARELQRQPERERWAQEAQEAEARLAQPRDKEVGKQQPEPQISVEHGMVNPGKIGSLQKVESSVQPIIHQQPAHTINKAVHVEQTHEIKTLQKQLNDVITLALNTLPVRRGEASGAWEVRYRELEALLRQEKDPIVQLKHLGALQQHELEGRSITLEQLHEQLQQEKRMLSGERAKVESMSSELERVRGENIQLKGQVNSLETRLSDAEATTVRLEQALKTVQKDARQKVNEALDQQDAVLKMKDKWFGLYQYFPTFRSRVSKTETQVKTIIDNVTSNIDDMTKQLAQAQQEKKESQDQLAELRSQLEQMQKERDEAREQAAQGRQIIAQAQGAQAGGQANQLVLLQQQLEQARAERDVNVNAAAELAVLKQRIATTNKLRRH